MADYIEQSAIESEPKLAQALEKLTSHLKHPNQPQAREVIEQLRSSISQYSQELASQLRISQLKELADAVEQSAIETSPELLQALENLTRHLQQLNPSPTREAVEQLAATVGKYPQELNAKSLPLFNLADHADPTQWPRVRLALLERYLLPEVFVDDLHQKGTLDADHQGRAMFIRHAMNEKLERGEVLGAELENFSVGQGGLFWIQFGRGEPRRVLITSSPVDALSLAALDHRQSPTLYLAVDGNGAIPMPQLQHFLKQDAQVLVALNTDQKALAQQLLKQLPKTIQRQPAQGNTWNEQYSNEGQRPDLVGIARNAIEDGCSRELVSKILSHHPAYGTPMEQQGLNATIQHVQNPTQQELEEQQQPQTSQPIKLSAQQLWQQYSQRVQSAGSFTTALEVARLAWKEGVPEAEIRQILQASPHLQRFAEKGRKDLVELPLAKVKREAALSQMSPQESKQQGRRRHLER